MPGDATAKIGEVVETVADVAPTEKQSDAASSRKAASDIATPMPPPKVSDDDIDHVEADFVGGRRMPKLTFQSLGENTAKSSVIYSFYSFPSFYSLYSFHSCHSF